MNRNPVHFNHCPNCYVGFFCLLSLFAVGRLSLPGYMFHLQNCRIYVGGIWNWYGSLFEFQDRIESRNLHFK